MGITVKLLAAYHLTL